MLGGRIRTEGQRTVRAGQPESMSLHGPSGVWRNSRELVGPGSSAGHARIFRKCLFHLFQRKTSGLLSVQPLNYISLGPNKRFICRSSVPNGAGLACR